MSSGKKTTYPVSLKNEAVRLYLEGKGSYRQLCEQFGIKDKRQLRNWVTQLRRGESLEDRRGKSDSPRKGRPRSKFDSLEEKLAYVEAERDYLKKLYRSRFGHEWGAHKKGTCSE